MANFSHLMDTMSRMRQGSDPHSTDVVDLGMPNLTNTPYYVGKTTQSVIEKVMLAAPGGDFVVRESERVKDSLVLMLKTSSSAGMQRRIVFRDGKFTMDVGGTKCSHESLDRLLQLEGQCRRPVGHKVLAAFSAMAARQGSSSTSSSSPSTQAAPVPASPASPSKSSREVLEGAMTAAECGDFGKALQLADQAKSLGASQRNLAKAIDYIKSIAPPGSMEQLAPKQPPPSVGTATQTFQVSVADGPDAARLGLGGHAVCTVSPDCTLSVLPRGSSSMKSEHRWPLPLLRRYGRKGDAFYFESGRRCASGPAILFLQTTAMDAVFEAVEAQLAVFRAKADQDAAAHAKAVAMLQAQKRADEERVEVERAAAVLKYKKEAERQVRLEEEQRLKAKSAREASDAAKRQQEVAQSEYDDVHPGEKRDARRSMIQRRNSAAVKRQDQAKQLTLSKKSETRLEPKSRTDASVLFGGEAAQEEEWGEGKSKIWKALNPKPLYYETAKDRRERSEAVVLGVVGGGRNFTSRRDMLSPELSGTPNPPSASASPRSASHPIIEEEEEGEQEDDAGDAGEIKNEEAEDDDVAEQFSESVNPDEAVEESVEEDEDEDEEDDGEAAELDTGLVALLEKNRAQRARDEEDHKRKLRDEYNRQQKENQEKLDKELAVIAVKKKIEKEEAEKEKEIAVREAQHRIETELVFDFTFS